MADNSTAPIGVFDSGVGGLSVLRELHSLLPGEDFIFFADQGNAPYGPRGKAQVREFSYAITEYLIAQGVKMIVIACNTASAAALKELRSSFPEMPFVGMEPAVKPAAETTETGVVAVLATPTTFEGDLYASVLERFAGDVQILQSPCSGLVTEIEAGRLNDGVAEAILREELTPMLTRGIDRVVLGCTHYPFAIPIIERIVGAQARVIDPAPAVARRVREMLTERDALNDSGRIGETRYLTTGEKALYERLIDDLIGKQAEAEQVGVTLSESNLG
jgi:glutamate racemase